jgi:hypothetical protein
MSVQPKPIEMNIEEKKRAQVLGYPVKKDPSTGIYKEQVTEHTVNEHGAAVPNSTMNGAYQGFSANGRMVAHVDPDYPDGYDFDPNQVPHGGGPSPVPLPGATARDVVQHELQQVAADPAAVHPNVAPLPPVGAPQPSERALQDARDLLNASSKSVELAPPPAAPAASMIPPPPGTPSAVDYQRALAERDSLIVSYQKELHALRLEADERAAQMAATPVEEVVQKPSRRIIFDYGAPMGKMTASYHNIVRENDILILEWDERYEDGNKYEPSNLGTQHPITVLVGKERETLKVISLGLSFVSKNICFIILMVDRRTPEEPQDA